MEWDADEDEKEHSVIDAKVAELQKGTSGYVPGGKILCKLTEGNSLPLSSL